MTYISIAVDEVMFPVLKNRNQKPAEKTINGSYETLKLAQR